MINRVSLDKIFMETAKLFAERSTCLRPKEMKGKVGAVIVQDNRIVSTGYTGSASGDSHCIDVGCEIDSNTGGCIRTLHSETNAIAFAARSGIKLENAEMFVTLSPCLDCAKLLVACGFKRVVYLIEYRDERGIKYLKDHGVICERYRD